MKSEAIGTNSSGSELFERALQDLDIDRRAREAGVADLPASDSSKPDANERQILSYFSDKLRAERARCDTSLSKLALDRTATSAKIEIGQIRSSLAGLFNAIEPDLARRKQDHQQDLEKAKDQEARSLRYLRYFQQENDLRTRAADPRPDPLFHFALVAVFAVVEWVSLSIFYAEGSDFGLLGGVLMAMALSLINIGLAVFAGALLRYINHKSTLRKGLALLGVLLLVVIFLFATGFAAHYRNASRDLTISSATPHSVQQGVAAPGQQDGGSKGNHGPLAAEDDQWKASRLAWQQFVDRGFLFSDVLSWLLIILAIMFGIVASWKGYGIDDRYPGYGPTTRRYEESKAAYEQARKAYTETVDGVFVKAGQGQQELLRNARREIEYFQDLASKSERLTSNYEKLSKQLSQTCNDVTFRYREENRKIATGLPPGYFKSPVNLDPDLTAAPEALSQRERALLGEYEAAIREFTDVVHKDDERRQALRTEHLGKLGEFFDRIERAINEKLAREFQV